MSPPYGGHGDIWNSQSRQVDNNLAEITAEAFMNIVEGDTIVYMGISNFWIYDTAFASLEVPNFCSSIPKR